MNISAVIPETNCGRPLVLLARLLFSSHRSSNLQPTNLQLTIGRMSQLEFDQLLKTASRNHVVVRGLGPILTMLRIAGDDLRAGWVEDVLAAERARIRNAMDFLEAICAGLEAEGCRVAVIKSLDHWPDLGSDLDLYTPASPERILPAMAARFQANAAPRSWGDRLAAKWNFFVPGLPEPVEIHVGRLGQTGEQVAIASGLMERSQWVKIEGRVFRIPSTPDRLMVATLQRIYRHFYFRLCDIADTTSLAETDGIDYDEVWRLSTAAGIWEGVATYLQVISDSLVEHRGSGLPLPAVVTASARFGGGDLHIRRGFLRAPILPHSASLYRSQLAGLLRKRELHNGARLSLLPWLATAAAVAQKVTGSDKGIW